MNRALHTPLCDLLGCDLPVVLAGTGSIDRAALVTAISCAGGFGVLDMVREDPDRIRAEIDRVRAGTARDFGVALMPAATRADRLAAQLDVCIDARVPAVALVWERTDTSIRRLRAAGILVLCQIGSAAEAVAAVRAGAQVIIAQGEEAGGPVRGTPALASLLPEVVRRVRVPVVAAGGIADGRALAAVLAQGAQGAVIGTAFLAADDAFAHDDHTQPILTAPTGAPRRTHVVPRPGPAAAEDGARPHAVSAGPLTARVPAAQRLQEIVRDAAQILAPDPPRSPPPPAGAGRGPASPVCYAEAAADSYAGFATTPEVLAFLNELLEAERAGARIAARTAAEATDPELAACLHQLRHDEARWCARLLHWIHSLEGEPSPRVGAFYEKCRAIPDLDARTAFIKRGQDWVARKLADMVPKIRNNALHAELTAMRIAHEADILPTRTPPPDTLP